MADYEEALGRRQQTISTHAEGIEVSEPVYDESTGVVQSAFAYRLKQAQDIHMKELIASDPNLDPEEAYDRWEMAKSYAQVYKESPFKVFSNLDWYTKDFFGGRVPDYKTAPKAILDAGVAQKKSMDIGRLYTSIMMLDGLDQWTGGAFTKLGFTPPSEADRSSVLAQIEVLKSEMAELQLDVLPRHWTTSLAKMIASAVPYTADIAIKGAIAGAAVGATAGSFGAASPVAIAAIKSMATTIVGYAAGVRMMVGMEYAGMIDRGIDPKAAAKWATLAGLVEPAIEQFLGIEGAVGGAISKGAVGRVTERVTEKLLTSGVLTKAAQIYGARVGLSALGEAIEEGTQSIISGFSTMFAQGMMEDSEVAQMVNPVTIQQIARDAAESMLTAAVVAPALGLPFDLALTFRDTKRLSEMAKQAPSMTKSAFTTMVLESGAMPETMSEDAAKKTAETIYDHAIEAEMASRSEVYETAKAAAKAGEFEAEQRPVERMAGGALRVQTQVVSEEKGGQLEDYTVASTMTGEDGKAQQYASLSILVSEDEAKITDAMFAEGYESLAPEIIQDIAARYRTKNVTIDTGIDPVITAAYESAIAENPLGEAFGPGWSDRNDNELDARAKNRIRFELADQKRLTPAQRESYVGLLQQFANASGQSFADFTKGLSIRKDTSGALRKAGMAGATAFKQDGKIVGAEEALKSAESIIYLAENATMPALVHETVHGFRVAMRDDAGIKAIEEAYGVADGVWAREHDERLAREFMAWSRDEAVPDQRVVPLFKKIASWLKQLWNGPIQKLDLDERVRKAFESWVSADRVVASEEEVAKTLQAEKAAAEKAAAEAAAKKSQASKKAKKAQAIEKAKADAAVQEAIHSYSEKVIARRKGSSEAEARATRIESGDIDAQIIAEAKLDAGLELTSDEEDIIAVAKQLAEDPENPETWPLLFMSQEELKQEKPILDEAIDADARQYDSWEEWARATGHWDSMTDKDKQWMKSRWEALKDFDESKALYKAGAFSAMMAKGDSIQDFVKKLSEVIYDRSEGSDVATDIARKIAYTPELNEAVRAYHETDKPLTSRAKGRIATYIRDNENIVKFLYAKVHGDEKLAHEAVTQQPLMPEIVKREFYGKPGRSLAEQAEIIAAIKNQKLADRISSGEATSEEVEAYISSLEKLHERELAEVAKSAQAEAAMLQKSIKARQRELAALRKVKAQMKKYKKFIFKAPKSNVDAIFRRAVKLVQEALKAGPGVDIKTLPSYSSAIFKVTPNEGIRAGNVIQTMLEAIENMLLIVGDKPMDQWSLDDMDMVAGLVAELEKQGRAMMSATIMAEGFEAKNIRQNLQYFLDNHRGRPKEEIAPDSEQWRARMESLKKKTVLLPFMRPDVFFRRMLGGGKGQGAHLFTDRANEMYNQKYSNYARRTAPVKAFIKEKGLASKMHRQIAIKGIMPDGSDKIVTAADLMGIYAYVGERDAKEGQFNEKQRDAILYGNYFSLDEKTPIGEETDIQTNERLMAEGKKRLGILFDAIYGEGGLTEDERTLTHIMLAVMDNEDTKIRFADAVYKVLRAETNFEKFFFPLVRKGDFTSDEGDAVMAAFKNAGYGDEQIDAGMAIDRQKIQPKNQGMVETDIMKVFFDSVLRQEHLINYGPELKKMRSVLESPKYSKKIQNDIALISGYAGQEYIKDYLDALSNPTKKRRHTQGSGLLGFLRGSQVIGNLAFRITGPLMQALTSPLPFIQEAPLELIKVIIEYLTSGHPVQFYKDIEGRSPTLSFRQTDMIEAQVKEITENNARAKAAKFISYYGMMPYTFVDRVSVSLGWEAVRRVQLKKLTDAAYKEAGASMGLSEQQQSNIEKAAMDYADRVVNKTQPTSEAQYRSPAYRNMDNFAQVMLQFTQPLNVIFNQVAYDIPDAIRANHLDKAFAIALSYALSGLAVGLVQAIRGRGPEDDEKWAAYWLAMSTSQFTDSIPLAGEFVTSLTRSLIVGDRMFISDNNMPALSFITNAADQAYRAASGENPELAGKAAENAMLGIAMAMGFPAGMYKEGKRFAQMMAGEE